MEGFIVVKLKDNHTFNGSFSTLKVPEIDAVHTILDPDMEAEAIVEACTAHDPTYTRFYGTWTYVLFASVVIVPILTWIVMALTKWWADKRYHARLRRQVAEDGFELQPVVGGRGNAPAAPPARVPPRPASARATRLQLTLVVSWLVIWRAIGLSMFFTRILFMFKVRPWLKTDLLAACLGVKNTGLGMSPGGWSTGVLIMDIYLGCFEIVVALCQIAAVVRTMQRRQAGSFFDPYDTDNWELISIARSWFCNWVGLTCFAFIMLTHRLFACTDDQRYIDFTIYMASVGPESLWYIINKLSRGVISQYLPAFGFPRFPGFWEDPLGVEGPIAEPEQAPAPAAAAAPAAV